MNVKTITAPTIHAALIEARRLLGDDVVLMESIPAQDGEPARITVMADSPGRSARSGVETPTRESTARRTTARPAESSRSESAASAQRSTRRNARAGSAAVGRAGYGYHGQDDAVAVLSEESARPAEGFSVGESPSSATDYRFDVGGRTLRDVAGGDGKDRSDPRVEPGRRGLSGPTGRGQLFPNRKELVNGSTLPARHDPIDAIERLIGAQLQLLHDRLDEIDRRFDGAIIGAGQAWTANPLFACLLNQGMRPAGVTKTFDVLAQKGYRPDTNPETLKWAVAQEFRRSLDFSASKQNSGAHVFVGPSGAGKTSLLLKLASHPGFFGRRETAVVVIEPEDGDTAFHHSPVELFRVHGLPVQSVRTVDEMRRAILRVQHFDHILIDTPPMPLPHAAARKVLGHVKRLVDPIMPLRVQFVLNATCSLDRFDKAFVHGLALRPEMVALTHLDETEGWGRIAEWLMAVEMPVQFVSTGPSVPDGVASFSPTWFVEEMMAL